MKLPIFCIENGDVMAFQSIASAERYLEPVDVRNNEYACFDSLGECLHLTVHEEKDGRGLLGLSRSSVEKVKIERTEFSRKLPDDLLDALNRFLANSGTEYAPLDELELAVDRYIEVVGFQE